MTDPSATDTDLFSGFQATFDHIGKRLDTIDRMEKRLTEVCSDVDELKRRYTVCNQAVELPVAFVSGVVPSTTAHSATFTPVTNNADNVDEEGIVTRFTWGKRMELEDETEDRESSMDRQSTVGEPRQLHGPSINSGGTTTAPWTFNQQWGT